MRSEDLISFLCVELCFLLYLRQITRRGNSANYPIRSCTEHRLIHDGFTLLNINRVLLAPVLRKNVVDVNSKLLILVRTKRLSFQNSSTSDWGVFGAP